MTVAALLCAAFCHPAAAAIELHPLWTAPRGPAGSDEAMRWKRTLDGQLANPPADCPRVEAPPLSDRKPARAFEFEVPETTDGTPPVVYLREPIAESFILVGRDSSGCLWVSASGRGYPFERRDLVSPFPNARLSDLFPGSSVTAVIQDSKTIRPWIMATSEAEFQSDNTVTWMILAAYSAVLLAMIAVGFDVWSRNRLVAAYALYVITLQLWLVQNFGLGAALFPFWPGPEHFPLMQSISVGGVVLGIGFAVVEFLKLHGLIGRIVVGCVLLSSAAFFSSAWIGSGYRIGAAVLSLLAVATIILVIRRFTRADLSLNLFAAGLGATLLGGGIQAASVIFGGSDVGRLAVFAFPAGNFVQSICWAAAITMRMRAERKGLLARLVHDATHDAVTGLPNRSYLVPRVAECLKRVRQAGDPTFGLLFLDLDRFKVVNDSLGHTAGDALLQGVAGRMLDVAADGHTVARFGGDEFLVLTERPTRAIALTRLAEDILTSISAPIQIGEREVQVGASIGVVLISGRYASVEEIIRDADIALYSAKQNGRGQYAVFEAGMREAADIRFRLENDLANGIRERQFEVFYQPIVRLETQEHAGFEALVRWRHPTRGLVSPADFIPVAEDTGLIRELGRLILRIAIEQVGEWKRQHVWREGWYVSINISGDQLHDDTLLDEIGALQARNGVASADIRLELTETAVISNIEVANRLLPQIRERGIALCMDDFGTGYSSLSYLADLPFNVLKIDKSFIDDVVTRSQQQVLVKTVLALAKEMKLAVVAEGIETAEQMALLREMRCGYGQGYFFAKPMATADALDWLRRSQPAESGAPAFGQPINASAAAPR